MALIVKDRVQQTGTANTTVSFTLSGTVTGFQSFAAIGNTNTTYYSATDTSGNWEVGLGTYSTTGPTLTRTTILSSSNSGSAVTFSGTVNVFVTYPSGKAILGDTSAVASTGTGSVVLSDSPTLTGNVSANVNLRSDTLTNLLALAGGTSEIASPTDSPTLVKYNGTAGQAKVLGYASAGTLNYYLSDSVINGLNAGTTIIDCNNVSYLNIYFDPNSTVQLNQLNIKLPASSSTPQIPELNVQIGFAVAGTNFPLYFNLSYQAIDVSNLVNFYLPITPDYPTAGIIGTAGAPASVGSYVINYTKTSTPPYIGSALTFSDGTTTYNSGTYITAVNSNGTQVTLSNPAKVASTGLTITAPGQLATGAPSIAKINFNTSSGINNAVLVKFVVSGQGAWTRLPSCGEATRDGSAGGGYAGFVGQKIFPIPSTVTLTSGTISNSSSLTLTGGVWLLSGTALFTTQVGMIGAVSATAFTTATSGTSSFYSAVNQQITNSVLTTILLTLPNQIIYVSNDTPNGVKYYGNALFTAGTGNTATVTSQVYIFAVRVA